MAQIPTVLVLSSWLSGSNAVVKFLEDTGADIGRPLTTSDGNINFDPYESDEYRSMLLATIDETNLEFKVSTEIFASAFKNWHQQMLSKAVSNSAAALVLHHPLSIFVLAELLSGIDSLKIVVVTREFSEIEKARISQNWPAFYGEAGAIEIYNQIYESLHESGISYVTISSPDFVENSSTRWWLLDFCGIDVSTETFETATTQLAPLPK